MILLTREDPPLNLARRRARRQMIEIRSVDLRFNREEAAEFLRAAMGLTLTTEQIAALENRTEGWIVGLQMAALSMRGATRKPFSIRSQATTATSRTISLKKSSTARPQPRGISCSAPRSSKNSPRRCAKP